MADKILFVDDNRNILETYKRQFRKEFEVSIAVGTDWGIDLLNSDGPYAVVISDFRMPNMDGVEYLNLVKERMPDASRILMTGYADVPTAMKAVNEGGVFRFLSKPCSNELLVETVRAGVEHHRFLCAEKDILSRTLNGCLKAITEVFSLSNPDAFGRTARIQRYMSGMVRAMGLEDSWRLDVATMLSQIGTVMMPESVLRKAYGGEVLSEQEQVLFKQYPKLGADLLAVVPRLEEVAEIIRYQEKQFDGGGIPEDACHGLDIPVEARILKVVLDFDELEYRGLSHSEAMQQLQDHSERYDPVVFEAFKHSFEKEKQYKVADLSFNELASEMILADSVRDQKGKVIVTKGQQLTDGLLMHLSHLAHQTPIREPIKVIIPISADEE